MLHAIHRSSPVLCCHPHHWWDSILTGILLSLQQKRGIVGKNFTFFLHLSQLQVFLWVILQSIVVSPNLLWLSVEFVITYHILICLTNKHLPHALLVLCHVPSFKSLNSLWRKRKCIAVMITLRRRNKNFFLLQEMLKMLLSCLNALCILAEHVFYSMQFFPGNCWNFTAHVVFWFFQRMQICFIHFHIWTDPQIKVTRC